MKYVGIWWKCWEIDLILFTKCSKLFDAELLPSGKHGATTENTKDTLTLLLKMVLSFGRRLECRLGRLVRKLERGSFDFVTPYPDFDIVAISAYAKSKT
jgi:hypothetical protein